MHIFRHFNSTIPQNHVWVIGNFDGLHLGHCALIQKALMIARQKHKKVGILSFSPHPREFFNPTLPAVHLMQFSQKVLALQALGVDYYYLHPFNQQTANLSALEFCQKIKQQLSPSHIIVGYDFHFGKDRTGTPQFLENFCNTHHIECMVVPPVVDNMGGRYASEVLRKHLSEGNIQGVKSCLSHDYIISGRVIHGKQQARLLGFPTANIALGDIFLPKFGVYKCRIVNMDNRIAIANLGIKPTFNNNTSPLLEVHIPHFQGDLYGKKLRVAFDDFIRPEIKFASVQDLKHQIHVDMQQL
jgi:riboflavin kinase/FMN adenylyltransferase